MPSLPRILTVDPTNNISLQVRGALDLMDRAVIQIDVPGGLDALEELKRSKCQLIITAWEPGDNMRGWELAAKIKAIDPEASIILLADYDDMTLDEEMQNQSPFVYMQRPFDVPQLLRVISAALDGKDIFEALIPPVSETLGTSLPQFGPVPDIQNLDKAKSTIHQLLSDLNAMAILLVTREGKVLIEQGTVGYIKRDELANALVPASVSHLNIREMASGNATLFQFYDGETYDIYVLSVGLHHQVVVLFDGQKGSRELGAVRNFGRRATEDLISLLGANAWLMQAPVAAVEEERPERRHRPRPVSRVEEEPVALARAEIVEPTPEPAQESLMPQLDAIDNLDLDFLLGGSMGDADAFFSLDSVEEELSKMEDRNMSGKLDWNKASELGLLKE